jgi:hypothetical protein
MPQISPKMINGRSFWDTLLFEKIMTDSKKVRKGNGPPVTESYYLFQKENPRTIFDYYSHHIFLIPSVVNQFLSFFFATRKQNVD